MHNYKKEKATIGKYHDSVWTVEKYCDEFDNYNVFSSSNVSSVEISVIKCDVKIVHVHCSFGCNFDDNGFEKIRDFIKTLKNSKENKDDKIVVTIDTIYEPGIFTGDNCLRCCIEYLNEITKNGGVSIYNFQARSTHKFCICYDADTNAAHINIDKFDGFSLGMAPANFILNLNAKTIVLDISNSEEKNNSNVDHSENYNELVDALCECKNDQNDQKNIKKHIIFSEAFLANICSEYSFNKKEDFVCSTAKTNKFKIDLFNNIEKYMGNKTKISFALPSEQFKCNDKKIINSTVATFCFDDIPNKVYQSHQTLSALGLGIIKKNENDSKPGKQQSKIETFSRNNTGLFFTGLNQANRRRVFFDIEFPEFRVPKMKS